MLMIGANTDPIESRIQICPVEARVDNGIVFGWKKLPVIDPLILANGILDKKNPLPTKEDATIIPELCSATKGMLEGAKREVGSVLKSAEVATLTPGKEPLDTSAVAGIVPGAKRYVGNVLKSAAVGTLVSPVPLAIRVPPEIRTPVVV